MKKLLFMVIKIGLAGILSLLILSLFTVVYNYTGIHIANPSGATDYKWIGGQMKSTMIEGFAWIKMDVNGFNNNTIAESSNIDILLMGSSHMEAAEIGETENVGYLLNQALPEMVTYNIGMSGHDVYRCAKNLRNAVQKYKPNSYVIIETDTVELTSEEIRLVLQEEMEPIKSYDSGLLYMLQKYCPAIKTIYKQICDWRNAEIYVSNESTDHIIDASFDEYISFIHKMRKDCDEKVTLIIFYQPAYQLDHNGDLLFEETEDYANYFAQACKDNNVVFINMTDRFRELYERDRILVHGFSNTGVGVGHLNKYGHKAIADTIAERIKEDAQ